DGLPAGRVVYDLTLTGPGGQATTMRGVQWYIVASDRLFAITVTGPVGDALIGVADRIGQSFRAHNAASAATNSQHRPVVHRGNLRQTPQGTPANVIGQVCPGEQV